MSDGSKGRDTQQKHRDGREGRGEAPAGGSRQTRAADPEREREGEVRQRERVTEGRQREREGEVRQRERVTEGRQREREGEVQQRERVAKVQRARMLDAMVELTRERGAERVTVAHVVAGAGVSRRTFYELFDDREACLLAALDEALKRIADAVLQSYWGQRGWVERVGAGLTAMLTFFDEEPGIAALCVVDALGAGPRALERRARVVDALVAAVDRGRREASAARTLNRITAEGVVGAVLGVLHTRLREESPKPVLPLRGQLMSMIVLPYLGPEAAAAEMNFRPSRAHSSARSEADALKHLDMRLTYRTIRVLSAIGAGAGLSNRQVASAAGIADQGQISKLLARLEGIGLIVNGREKRARGGPNAWMLTPRGGELERAIHARTDV